MKVKVKKHQRSKPVDREEKAHSMTCSTIVSVQMNPLYTFREIVQYYAHFSTNVMTPR